jgi:hypothetical protein
MAGEKNRAQAEAGRTITSDRFEKTQLLDVCAQRGLLTAISNKTMVPEAANLQNLFCAFPWSPRGINFISAAAAADDMTLIEVYAAHDKSIIGILPQGKPFAPGAAKRGSLKTMRRSPKVRVP